MHLLYVYPLHRVITVQIKLVVILVQLHNFVEHETHLSLFEVSTVQPPAIRTNFVIHGPSLTLGLFLLDAFLTFFAATSLTGSHNLPRPDLVDSIPHSVVLSSGAAQNSLQAVVLVVGPYFVLLEQVIQVIYNS